MPISKEVLGNSPIHSSIKEVEAKVSLTSPDCIGKKLILALMFNSFSKRDTKSRMGILLLFPILKILWGAKDEELAGSSKSK